MIVLSPPAAEACQAAGKEGCQLGCCYHGWQPCLQGVSLGQRDETQREEESQHADRRRCEDGVARAVIRDLPGWGMPAQVHQPQ